jgi:hypothetical protein
MWMKITKYNHNHTGPGDVTHEQFEGNIEHGKTLMMLQPRDFTGIQAMYIMDLDDEPVGNVKIYEVSVDHKGVLGFNPFAFHDKPLERIGANAQTRAQININAMILPRKDGRAIEKLLETMRVS